MLFLMLLFLMAQLHDSTKYDYDCIDYTKNSKSVVTTRLAMIARDVFLSETSSRR